MKLFSSMHANECVLVAMQHAKQTHTPGLDENKVKVALQLPNLNAGTMGVPLEARPDLMCGYMTSGQHIIAASFGMNATDKSRHENI
jgi:hypothetical protein